MPLSDREIKSAKQKDKDYKLSDEKGLYLLITKAGGKLFRLKYRINGKEKKLAIGPYPDISLKKARDARDQARIEISNGVDPAQVKKEGKAARLLVLANSFESIANEWLK